MIKVTAFSVEGLNSKDDMYISRFKGRYCFHAKGRTLHSLDIASTSLERLQAHWEGFVANNKAA